MTWKSNATVGYYIGVDVGVGLAANGKYSQYGIVTIPGWGMMVLIDLTKPPLWNLKPQGKDETYGIVLKLH